MEFMQDAQPTQLPQQPPIDPMFTDPYMGMQAQNLLLQKEHLDVLKHYSSDETIPEDIRNSKWSIFGKGLQLTFLEESDLPIIDMFNNILRIDSLMGQPAHKLTFEQSHQLDQTQLYMYLQAKRSIGTNQGKVNERTLQVTQIGQSISQSTMSTQSIKQRNMLSKLRGML
ncbi:MAG: hypothetical protein IH934_04705 [Nanoarchaeota archaeon]|nr:hypothetical protein [Nanoarchaeota archaeon]